MDPMISYNLLHPEAVLHEPPGDFADVVWRHAELCRILLWGQELVVLRGLRIMLLGNQLIERRLLRIVGLQKQNHVFHREARIHLSFTRGAGERRVYTAGHTHHVAFTDVFPDPIPRLDCALSPSYMAGQQHRNRRTPRNRPHTLTYLPSQYRSSPVLLIGGGGGILERSDA